MLYIAYISFLFLGWQLISVILNMLFKQKIGLSEIESEELISVLIPARNEEKNISQLLPDLQRIEKQNVEIIVFDDDSNDNTAKIVEDFARRDKRIILIQSDGLLPGWLGKNYACYRLSQKAKGKYFLFLDADVRIDSDVITEAVAYLKKYKLKLLSVFPIQVQRNFGERISVPVMNYILLTLLPLIFVRTSPFAAHAAANGQFMLFDAETYLNIQPHLLFKDFAVEDIAIARYFKKRKEKIACLTGEKRIKCRMYSSYKEAIRGFSKNVFMFFGNIHLFAILFWLHSAFGFVPVLISMPQYFIYYLITLIFVIVLYSYVSKQNIVLNIILFPLQIFSLMIIIVNDFLSKKQKKLEWKERSIYF